MKDRVRAVALGSVPADLVLKNCRVVDVVTEKIYESDIAVADGVIAGIGSYDEAEQVVDVRGAFVSPGLINAHCHVESSMTVPEYYCAEELRWGVTTLITDPHEIANVAGIAGIKYMLDAGRSMPVNYFVEVPSCVPATEFEHAGSKLDAADMEQLLQCEGVLGMGEMMNVPGVLNGSPDVAAKIDLFRAHNRIIDGHAPLLTGKNLQAYAGCGISTDHEAISWEEAKEKLRAGMAILVREGSASKNLQSIIEGVVAEKYNSRRMAFCTDDKHLADIKKEGSIRHCVLRAIALGMSPLQALAMATVNAAEIYGLKNLGVIAPGYQADLLVFESFEDLRPLHVYHKGKDVLPRLEGKLCGAVTDELCSSVKVKTFLSEDFSEKKFLRDKLYPVIKMLPGEIFTEKEEICGADVSEALAAGELCMIAVLERHHATGHIGLGLLRGYGLKNGAAATTFAHDSHNLIVAGTNAADMYLAAKELVRVQGGYTLAAAGGIVDTLSLDVCGLMSSADGEELISGIERLGEAAHNLGVLPGIDPFISLSFMALPVIPKLRITDMGIFDVEKFAFTEQSGL